MIKMETKKFLGLLPNKLKLSIDILTETNNLRLSVISADNFLKLLQVQI